MPGTRTPRSKTAAKKSAAKKTAAKTTASKKAAPKKNAIARRPAAKAPAALAGELEILHAIQEGMAARHGFQKVIDHVGDRLRRFFDTGDMSIRWWNPETNTTDWLYAYEHGKRLKLAPTKLREKGPTYKALTTRKVQMHYGGNPNTIVPGTDAPEAIVIVPIMGSNRALGTIQLESWTSDVAPFESSTTHAGTYTFDDQVALQLGDYGDDDNDRASQCAAGVELFAEADELDVEMVQFVEYFEEVLDRASQAIAGPDHDHIEASAASVAHEVVETGPACLRTADAIGVLADDLETALRGEREAEDFEEGHGVIRRAALR